MITNIYISEFDYYHGGQSDHLDEALRFSSLTYDRLLISGAGPFKNKEAFQALKRNWGLVELGYIRFPLDPKYKSISNDYIPSRISILRDADRGHDDVELSSYSDPQSEEIFRRLESKALVVPRVESCSSVYSELVYRKFHQVRSGEVPIGCEMPCLKDEILEASDLICSMSGSASPFFQRFKALESLPRIIRSNQSFIVPFEQELDTLFRHANAIACDSENVFSYSNSNASQLAEACRRVSVGKGSLYSLIMSLNDLEFCTFLKSDAGRHFRIEIQRIPKALDTSLGEFRTYVSGMQMIEFLSVVLKAECGYILGKLCFKEEALALLTAIAWEFLPPHKIWLDDYRKGLRELRKLQKRGVSLTVT